MNERRLPDAPPWLGWRDDAPAQLDRLKELAPNFDPKALSAVGDDAWHVDDYCRGLPTEPPGDPVRGGAFEVAKRLMRDYEFADPHRIRAYFRADAPLEGRDMLLEIRYAGLRVRVGVRVGPVFDEVRRVDGRAVRIWGWAYRTLEGHLERGQMDYQVWKWLDSGEVEYRIHAVAQIAKTRNPILNLGFRIVGRRQQVRFARHCAERMVGLVSVRQRGGAVEPAPLDSKGDVLISPSP